MKNGHQIDTVSQFVKAFGGNKALAEWCDVVPSTICNWKEQDYIPPGWHLRLYLESQKRKLPVALRLFGITPSNRQSVRKANGHDLRHAS